MSHSDLLISHCERKLQHPSEQLCAEIVTIVSRAAFLPGRGLLLPRRLPSLPLLDASSMKIEKEKLGRCLELLVNHQRWTCSWARLAGSGSHFILCLLVGQSRDVTEKKLRAAVENYSSF